jgi:hypothetical protein
MAAGAVNGAGSGSLEKIDLKKDLAAFYKAGKASGLVEVPPLPFLMIDGEGNPNGPEFQDAGIGMDGGEPWV